MQVVQRLEAVYEVHRAFAEGYIAKRAGETRSDRFGFLYVHADDVVDAEVVDDDDKDNK